MVQQFAEIPGVEWVADTGEFIRIASDSCIGCGNCLKVCLGGCFALRDKKAFIKSLEKCMECGACWYVCEPGAIVFEWPAGGKGFRTMWG
ncbi:MAG: ATP-binding protein [Thermodesulfobacteriota bacterium]